MNTIVEHINSAGFSFVEFAVPMLVQSGILIVILLLADLLLRKKVKAVFRYWIWMLVLLKLVLPTSLSSPLSLGYLFGDKLTYQDLAETTSALELAEPAPAETSPGINPIYVQPNPYIPPSVSVTPAVEPAIAETVSPPAASVTPLSWQGVVFLVWLAVVIAMGLLLLQRALFVRGLVAQAKKASCLMNDALEYCRASMKIKCRVGLKVSPNATTPSVCGLIRPVILVPWNLASTLGASRLRTVLMHELAHIRRADLWVNLAQTILQIIYFYNPLLWLANCVIRRIREQAVDEAVLVVMGAKAQKYPQTLVDVAKMAFKRPALSLRLLGVVESKSALAGRIKHILGRPMPKSAKLGLISILAIIIAGAVLLPMAKAKKAIFAGEGGPDVQVSAQELVAKIIESERKIEDIQLHMTCTIPARNLVFYEFDWGYDGGKEFYTGFQNSTEPGSDEISRTAQTTKAFDGQKEWRLRVSSKDKQPRGAISESNFSTFRAMMTFNTLLGFDAKELSSLSFGEAIARAESVSVRDKVEFIDGHPCYVIEAVNLETDPSVNWAYDVRAWIDYQRDYRLLKFEKCRSISGKNRFRVVSRRVDNIKLKQIDGIWLPVEGRRTTFSTNDNGPPRGMSLARFASLSAEEQKRVGVFKLTPMLPPRRLEVDVESIRLNKGVPSQRFTIAFPKGCEVYDGFTGNRYVVGEPSEREAALSDADWIEQMAGLSVGELIDILRNSSLGKDKKKWFAAVHRLVEVGSAAVPELVAELRQTEKPQTQSRLALTLRAIGDPSAVPGLIDGLGRSGFSSDYGIGKARTELDMFFKQHQLDPAQKSLGLARPVREITIALEKLTGHTEGHGHFHAYDLKYDRLGSYTVTPEIRDRQRQHRRRVAQRWRKWWQANKDNIKPAETLPKPPDEPRPARSEKLEKMILAAPEGSMLTFAVVPNVDGSGGRPSLTKEEYQRYLNDLAQNGPFSGSIRGDSFQWSPIKGDPTRFRGLPLSTYEERTYLLLCARAQYVMMPELEGKWAWGLEKVQAAQDGNGKPIISIQFDEKGSELFYELTKANIGNHLAIGVDGWVLSAPTIETPLTKRAVITGDFTQQQVRTFVEELRKGMTPVDQQTVKAMQIIAEAADKLNKHDVAKMGPRQVVENFLIAGLGGLNEKLRWFVRPGSAVDKILDGTDLSEELSDGYKIKVVNEYAGSKDAFAVTSDITDQYGEQIGQFMFYLSNESDSWLIYDLDAGKADRVSENLTEFLSTHPDVQLEVEQGDESPESKNTEPTAQENVKNRGRISGVIVNSVTGEPIAGAYVGVGDFGDSGGSNYSRHRSQGFHDKTRTDEQGRFELNGLVFTDKHRELQYHPLVVTHPDFVRHDEEIELLSGGPSPDVKVSLRPAAKIDVAIVDADGNPLQGQWLLRLEALDGRHFIPPGSDPHLSSFASNIWAHWPDLRTKMGVSNGFTFTELDTGRYSIEALKFQLVDKPTTQNIWKPTITYHGAIPGIEIEAGQARQVKLAPQDNQTQLTITAPEFPDKLMDKLERSSQMPLMCLISRSPGIMLWDDGKIRHLEDQRLGRIDQKRFFRGFFSQGQPLTINNLPSGSYSLFTMAVYGQVAGYLIGARADLARGDNITVDIPWRQPTGPSMFGPNRSFDYPVNLEARDYSGSQLCGILTEITQSNPRIIADSSIENETLRFVKGQMSVWDVLEKLYLDKGWKLDEEKEKTLIIRPTKESRAQTDVEKLGEKFSQLMSADLPDSVQSVKFHSGSFAESSKAWIRFDIPLSDLKKLLAESDMLPDFPDLHKNPKIQKDMDEVYKDFNVEWWKSDELESPVCAAWIKSNRIKGNPEDWMVNILNICCSQLNNNLMRVYISLYSHAH